MSRTINVLCAPPNGRNAGMASVDMAFGPVAEQVDAEVRYWRLWDQSEWIEPPGISTQTADGQFADPDTGLDYHLLRGRLDEFLDADAAVFWGDFLHMAVYQRHVTDVLHRRIRAYADPRIAAEVVAEHQLLRGRTRSPGHVISYGSTLSMNTPEDYLGPYGEDLATFMDSAHRVWLRDGYSSQTARMYREGRLESCQGLDAAFLLGERDRRSREDSMAVFLGRSTLRPETIAGFGAKLARRLGLRPQMLQWGEAPAFWPIQDRRRFRAAWPGLEHGTPRPTPAERVTTWRALAGGQSPSWTVPSPRVLFDQIARSSVVLTDTYHLAVNAWRLGTPAVLVVDPPGRTWSVNSGEPGSSRDKRHDLYSQLDALDFLVETASLPRAADDIVDRVATQLAVSDLVEVTHRRVADLRAHALDGLVSVLTDLVGPRS